MIDFYTASPHKQGIFVFNSGQKRQDNHGSQINSNRCGHPHRKLMTLIHVSNTLTEYWNLGFQSRFWKDKKTQPNDKQKYTTLIRPNEEVHRPV